MKKIKEFFVRLYDWFCNEFTTENSYLYQECYEYLEPKITEESSKENKEINETVTKEIIDPVKENSRKKRRK